MNVAYQLVRPNLGNQEPADDLILRVQAGDHGAFKSLYDLHSGRVYALCIRILGDQERASEATQTVFIKVWESIQSFRHESAFTSWLHRVAVNTVLVELRTERRKSRMIDVLDIEHENVPGHKPTGTQMDLEQSIAELPPQARAIFVLHDIEGYTHEEIAVKMGLATGTTKAQLHRARNLLKEALNK